MNSFGTAGATAARLPATGAPTARLRAIAHQADASDPAVSAFVTASAGSGKTKLLTDRILRLMLGGAHPARIQCLTFTKAAAAEMSLRLQHRLGEWVTLDDAALDAGLAELQAPATAATRQTARALFAQVLDLPGGMRIGTIHAFCQGLLRRFPLEAEVSPHFDLVEEVEAEAEMQAARDAVLEHADPGAVTLAAGLVRAEAFAKLVRTLQQQRGRLAPLLVMPAAARQAAIRRSAGAEYATETDVIAAAVVLPDPAPLQAALRRMGVDGSDKVRPRANAMLAWLSMSPAQRQADWTVWRDEFFNGDNEPRGFGQFPNKKLAQAHPEILEALEAEQTRLWRVEDACRAVRCADATEALLHLAIPSLDAYARQKQRAGLLDYNDLIARTERLLHDPGAAWVLYKLDGGIDHLLLDEVQDTAPEQWRIAHRLTEEFFAGAGAGDRATPRTFFAVGDPKQSIYSFQGADPAEFLQSRAAVAARVAGAARTWRDVALDVSFRSTAPVLRLVDAVFDDPAAADGVVEGYAHGGRLHHEADRAGAAGAVELWPLAPRPPKQDRGAWQVAHANQALVSAPQRLADALAARVAAELAQGVRLESRDRALQPGDILILVQRRGPIGGALVRALKAHGVPVAGLDVIQLTEQAAVADMLAACDAVLLPEDCLQVAAVLTSPLGGLSDDSLMRLALDRPGRLWDTLRDRHAEQPDWTGAWRFLSSLAERADYVSPHALLAEALGPLGGRARLLARLGAEAAEPIDELLNAALAYTRLHPPGLQGFVHWLRRSGARVKREPGGAGSVVRVMTVHGAKGLQAPVVILPDTTGWGKGEDRIYWAGEPEVPLWAPRKELVPAAVTRAQAAAADAQRQERNRLLYVALTRAEDRLLICGWEPGKRTDDSWHATVARGLGRLDAIAAPFEAWDGTRLTLASPQLAPPARTAARVAEPLAAVPPWAGAAPHWRAQPLPDEPALPRPLAPSRPEGESFGPIPPAQSPLGTAPLGASAHPAARAAPGRFARGAAVHALLQHLPAMPDTEWPGAIANTLARAGIEPAARQALADQVLATLRHPELSDLFGPAGRAEQPLTGLVAGQVVTGVVDRLAVLDGRILLADFKTGRAAPADVAATPVRYLRQLAAYREVLHALFPGHAIRCTLVWTEGPTVAVLPGPLLDRHAPTSLNPRGRLPISTD